MRLESGILALWRDGSTCLIALCPFSSELWPLLSPREFFSVDHSFCLFTRFNRRRGAAYETYGA
jgi:hypothetical protein